MSAPTIVTLLWKMATVVLSSWMREPDKNLDNRIQMLPRSTDRRAVDCKIIGLEAGKTGYMFSLTRSEQCRATNSRACVRRDKGPSENILRSAKTAKHRVAKCCMVFSVSIRMISLNEQESQKMVNVILGGCSRSKIIES